MNINKLEKISNKYGTPSFVFDCDEVIRRAEEIKRILNEGIIGKSVNLCYSIKANPFLIRPLIDVVDYFEVCSPGELNICIENEIPGNMIIYSGVNKGIDDVISAVSYDSYIITAESVKHYELILNAIKATGRNVRVILRLSSKSQFGMSIEDMETILKRNAENKAVNIIGIHYFAGTQRSKLKHQQKELAMLKEVILGLREKYELPLDWFEYGPGLPYPYFEGEDFSDTLCPLKELKPDIDELTTYCNPTIEMGRFLASCCGYYLTKVVDVKNSYDNNWVIVDGGINHVNYLGSMMGLKTPVIEIISKESSEESCAQTICGSLCTTNDVLVRSFEGKKLTEGDVLVFRNIGAYSVTEGLNLFLSRTMPKVILHKKDEDILKRDDFDTFRINSGLI